MSGFLLFELKPLEIMVVEIGIEPILSDFQSALHTKYKTPPLKLVVGVGVAPTPAIGKRSYSPSPTYYGSIPQLKMVGRVGHDPTTSCVSDRLSKPTDIPPN